MAWISGFLIDDDMYDILSQWSWGKDRDGYGQTKIRVNGKRSTVRMHRYIVNAPEGSIVDHINGKVWDNRRENLRLVDKYQSATNRRRVAGGTSKYKGVHKETRLVNAKGKEYKYEYWYAQLKKFDKKVYTERFNTELEAAHGYDKAAKEWHGEYAKLNFPDM